MRRVASTLGVFLASAILSFSAVLLFAWPVDTWADDAAQGAIPPNAAKIGSLLASSRLVQDERARGNWYVELSVTNTTKERGATADLEACLEQRVFNPMARGPAPGTIVWRDHQAVTVPAGQTIILRRPIPAALAAKVAKAQRPDTRSNNGMPSAVTSYTTFVRRTGAEQG